MDSDDDPEYRPASSESDGQPPQPPSLPSPRLGESIRKRRLKTVEPSPIVSPPKRQKGVFNSQYLNILNEEICDAAAGIIRDEPLDLAPAQIGIVSWTPSEKHVFFSALARLGRDNIAGIAARVGTKSPLEVQQYLVLLDGAERAHRENDGKRQRALRPVDVPAAVELSTELCAALEQAADGIALRCERHETALEQKRWQGRWLVTSQLARLLEHQQRANSSRSNNNGNSAMAETNHLPPFAELFILRNWLRLSERVFMNSSVVPDGNWRGISEEPPSIRATALADFHSLALSVTRRLVSATLYVASSRVRAKRAGDRRNRTGGLVKIKDVQAAVASVGMTENSRKFWARAARRLRLDVYDDEQDDESEDVLGMTDQEYLSNNEHDEEDLDAEAEDVSESDVSEREEEPNAPSEIGDNKTDTSSTSESPPMPYDEVEATLGFPPTTRPFSHPTQEFPADLPEISSSSSEHSFSDSAPDTDSDSDIPMKDPPEEEEEEEDSPALAQDLHEALTYTATYDRTATARSRDALRARIRTEHQLWADAEHADAQAAGREEARLWRVVHDGRGRVKAEAEEEDEQERGHEKKGEGGPEMGRRSGLVDLGANWRDHIEYYSEWEVTGGRIVAEDSNAKD
ncbi:uncharacterized protein F4817DRAFT_365799 [Daldinia loculata]|uniref:uncharacterized protein n=1 Tax=Daldinia loculata TaxID=103429 RepID=UPI0020C35E14|nr:uncharacterized protein F4817DRAFT_365799 [Daldinia loculata]KAI1651386.1 hypothetical protein F4817DRAFT_365799 [Daldinia loculata]